MVGEFGRVNLLVNNAGVSVSGDFEEMTYDDFDWIVGVNLNGVVNGTKEFLPHLIASGNGALVNISSLFGLISMPGQTAYNATKYAVRGFTEALREEMLDQRPPGDRHLRPPGRHQDRHRAPRSHRRPARTTPKLTSLFEKKLARMPADKAAEIILEGRRVRQGARARRRRRPPAAPLRQAHRLALPGRGRPHRARRVTRLEQGPSTRR